MKINIFTPPQFEKKDLNIEYLSGITNKNWIYCANGRASIYHILKALNVDKVLIPVYICHTVLIPLKKLNIKPIFYDIEQEDLNPSLESIKQISKKYDVKVVLVSSMYGNPANLIEIEKYCKENNINMIDDAAQSFGSKLNHRYVGTFGNAGFFSFSPGKPTAGHMGSFFWSDKDIVIKRSKHFLTHYFRWLDFYINRYKIYNRYNIIYKKLISLISRLLLKFIDVNSDGICSFEKSVLGGILYNNINHHLKFRNKYYKDFIQKFEKNYFFRIIKPIRGIPNHHKIVLIFDEKKKAWSFLEYMRNNDIYSSNGYKLLTDDLIDLPNAQEIDKCVVELPIEDDKEKMSYLFKKVEEFEYKNQI